MSYRLRWNFNAARKFYETTPCCHLGVGVEEAYFTQLEEVELVDKWGERSSILHLTLTLNAQCTMHSPFRK